MALTKAESATIHNIDKTVALNALQLTLQGERLEKLEKIIQNGLTHKTQMLYDWMLKQEEGSAVDDQQAHEISLLGVKMTQERKNQIINGGFILAGILLTSLLQ